MDCIYHEKQEGSLCAVHCLNALLQSGYFSAVDLAALASRMDTEEQQRMAEQGTHTTEYRDFMKEGSNNMDDSGMFSVQVLSAALEVWGLMLTPFTSTVAYSACAAREDPTSGGAYICNMREHWFTVRRLGKQWFNLNSLLEFPELLSNTYLSLFLVQLQTQGYNIYLVEGELPYCKSNDFLCTKIVTQSVKPLLLSELTMKQESSSSSQEEDDIAAAVAASLAYQQQQEQQSTTSSISNSSMTTRSSVPNNLYEGAGHRLGGDEESIEIDLDSEQRELEKALQLSLTEHLTTVPRPATIVEGDLEKALRLSLANCSSGEASTAPSSAAASAAPSSAAASSPSGVPDPYPAANIGSSSPVAATGSSPAAASDAPSAAATTSAADVSTSTAASSRNPTGSDSSAVASSSSSSSTPDEETLRRKRLQFFGGAKKDAASSGGQS